MLAAIKQDAWVLLDMVDYIFVCNCIAGKVGINFTEVLLFEIADTFIIYCPTRDLR